MPDLEALGSKALYATLGLVGGVIVAQFWLPPASTIVTAKIVRQTQVVEKIIEKEKIVEKVRWRDRVVTRTTTKPDGTTITEQEIEKEHDILASAETVSKREKDSTTLTSNETGSVSIHRADWLLGISYPVVFSSVFDLWKVELTVGRRILGPSYLLLSSPANFSNIRIGLMLSL